MAISTDDVLHVARLARLSLTEEEVGRMAEQLSTVLEHVEALRGVDLAGVEPTAHALDVANVENRVVEAIDGHGALSL